MHLEEQQTLNNKREKQKPLCKGKSYSQQKVDRNENLLREIC